MPRVRYRLSVKSAMPDSGVPAAAEAPAEDAATDTPAAAATQEWAGDLLDHADEASDPTAAFATFRGPNSETAWLDRAPNGTCVGWVKTDDQTVYRYNDVDAWAIDVDDAGMTRTDDGAAETPDLEPDQNAVDPQADKPLPLSSEAAAASGGASSSTRDQTNTPFPNLQGKGYALRVTRA